MTCVDLEHGARARVRTSFELRAGEKKEVTLDAPSGADASAPGAPPEAAPVAATSSGFFSPMRIAGVAVGAAGIGGAAVGTIFLAGYLSGKSDAQEKYDACNPGCTMSQETTIKAQDKDVANKGTIATIGLTAGGAAARRGRDPRRPRQAERRVAGDRRLPPLRRTLPAPRPASPGTF